MKPYMVLLGLLVLTLAACNPNLKRTDSKLKKIEEPFGANKYFSDKKFFRSTGEGRALDLTVAKRIAENNARQAIAAQVQVQVSSVNEQFLQNRNLSNKLETTSKYEEITRSVIDQTLANLEIFDRESFQNKKGEYVHYVAMQMSTTQVLSDLNEKILNDAQLKQEFDLQRFREIYEKELKEFRDGN